MKYIFLLYNDENDWEAMPDAEKQSIYGAYAAYSDDLRKGGHYVSGAPLEHTRLGKRVSGGVVEDGPFADGKEQLGGFFMVEAADLDQALDLAAACPCASYGHVEVRPVWNIGG